MRRELGTAAQVFLRRRLYRRLGFVRLSDYARERLGISGRTLQAAAWLATRLDDLPSTSRAYDRSELSWARARAICTVASVDDEERWLATARRHTVDHLERLARRASPRGDVSRDPEPDTGEIDGEPAIRWRFACPARVRAFWRRAVELASRMAGQPLAAWEAAEIIAAEGFSGRPSGVSLGDRVLIEAMRSARRRERERARAEGGVAAAAARGAADDQSHHAAGDAVAVVSTLLDARHLPEPAGNTAEASKAPDSAAGADDYPTDAFALDARLHEAMRVIRTAEPRIGRLLRVVVDHRLYRSLGYPKLDDYVRERLGISMRKVWALAKVERATGRSAEFGAAYREGRLSWVQALVLLPVLERMNAAAWIARADAVTVRRLGDEVAWALEARDVSGSAASLVPPPLGCPLTSPAAGIAERCHEAALGPALAAECRDLSSRAAVQIGARWDASTSVASVGQIAADLLSRSEVSDAEITLIAPASVVALLRDVLDAFAHQGSPRWIALERLLVHVVRHWESTPRHPDPIFGRDGWRCTVPGCSSRRNLHDHHIRFRSRGGLDTRENRTAVCAAHHLHGIHAGTICASGTAPSAIRWQLGVRSGAPPFATYVGDRRCG